MTACRPDIIARDAGAVRQSAGVWTREGHTLLLASGADAASWLHAQTTCDINALTSGEGCEGALLDRQGRVQATAWFFRWDDVLWALCDAASAEAVVDRLNTHRFLEDVQIEDVGQGGPHVLVQGPKGQTILERAGVEGALPTDLGRCGLTRIGGIETLIFRLSATGEDGFILVPAPAEAAALQHAIENAGAASVCPEAQDALRVEWGLPLMGVDIPPGTLISETPLRQTAVSDAKGCYQGQEVVARMTAYGAPKQALIGLRIQAQAVPPPGPLRIDGRRVGRLTSAVHSPTLGGVIALAYLDRDHRAPGAILHVDADGERPAFSAEAALLPFHENLDRRARAKALYADALAAFEADKEDRDGRCIELLEEAVRLWPEFEDAYESLGVILHRHQRVDEAIAHMKTLAALRPDSVMAHANLSVFYLAKGMIDEAEAEKAQAAALERRTAAVSRNAEEVAAAERVRIAAQARDRLRMFLEVLELDADDAVALMGAGSAQIQLGAYDEAVPYLRRAVAVKPDYSAAWLNLGKCLEFTERLDEARAVYREGIEAASRKGDLMPLREMERRLAALK